MEVHERLARGEERMDDFDRRFEEHKKEADKRFEKNEAIIESIHDIAFGVKQLGSDMIEVKADVKNVNTRLNEVENRPAKSSHKVLIEAGKIALGVVVGALVGVILATLGLGV